jgi:hypothetical protein
MKILSSIALSLALTCALFGQQVTNGNRYFVPGTGVGSQVANDGTIGTTLNKLAKLTSGGAAIITGLTDVSGIEGVVVGNAGTTGLAAIAKLEVEFSGRQGNGCDIQGSPSGIDYRQAYLAGNKVVSIVDSQRLLIKNLTIYTNGGADTGIDIDQDLLILG